MLLQAQKIGFFEYILDPYEYEYILNLFWDHLYLVSISMLIASTVGLLIGIVFTRPKFLHISPYIMYLVSFSQTIPPLAILAIVLSFVGIGESAALLALSLHSILPIARNTLTGILQTPFAVKDAAKGLGMKQYDILIHIELPYASSLILSGFRVALVLNISTATLGSLIGAGGMGELVFTGIEMMDTVKIIAGALPITLLALGANSICICVQKHIVSKGLQTTQGEKL